MKYPFKVFMTENDHHVFWVAESPILKGCTGQGETIEEAISELEINEKEWLLMAEKYDIEIPQIPIEIENLCSGKFTVRVAPHIHKEAIEHAKQQGISLNQYVNDALVSQNSRIQTSNYIFPELAKAISELKSYIVKPFFTKSYAKEFVTITDLSCNPSPYIATH